MVSTDLESEAKNRGESVIIFLADFLWSQVIIPGLFTQGDKDYVTQSVFCHLKDLVLNVPPTIGVYTDKVLASNNFGFYLLLIH